MTKTKELRVQSPEDLLACVPCFLGFHPRDSVVMLVVEGAESMCARVDLPRSSDDLDEVAESLILATDRVGAGRVALVLYTEDELLARRAARRLAGGLEEAVVEVVVAIQADAHRWYWLPTVPGLTRSEGHPYDISAHRFLAQQVYEGAVTYPDRGALEDSLVGTDLEALERVEEAVAESVARLASLGRVVDRFGVPTDRGDAVSLHLSSESRWLRRRLEQATDGGEPLDHDEVGRAVAALSHIEVRDAVWAQMNRATASAHVQVWRDVVRRTPLDMVAAPAALLGFAAWLAGDGALAWCAVERCREADPGYTMAALLTQTLAGAVPPSTWDPAAMRGALGH